MSYFDLKNMDKMSEEQKAQINEFLKAYPQLQMQDKMETSRQLNTPASQELGKKKLSLDIDHAQTILVDDDFDPIGIEQQQREEAAQAPKPLRPLGTMKISEQFGEPQQSFESEEQIKYKEQREVQQEQERKDADAADLRRRLEEKSEPTRKAFSAVGKVHPVVARMRQSLGMQDIETTETLKFHGVSYEMKRLMREDLGKASSLASVRTVDDVVNLRSSVETAIVAFSVISIDGVSVADVFEVPFKRGSNDVLTSRERKDKGSQLLFEFLISAPSEITDALITFYEQCFPTIPMSDTVLALCPEAGCEYKALIQPNDTRYCPYHGQALRSESTLPNPS